MIERVILIVLDGAGVGEMPDADKYNDKGANTLGHVFKSMGADFICPNMEKLGLLKILNLPSQMKDDDILGCYGKSKIASPGKDTVTGHWEMMGIILKEPFPTFTNGFPKELIEDFESRIGVKTLGNVAASGTEIINLLGDEHVKTGCPIIYTSADSVFQIAAHEESFGLARLYEISQAAREMLVGKYALGRVIARPFIGSNGAYKRTVNRKDLSISPYSKTLLDVLKSSGGQTKAIGKIEDIFNFCGITHSVHSHSNDEGMEAILEEVLESAGGKTLIFANLVDFDSLWGHRRDFISYANGLKNFDNYLPRLISAMGEKDLLIITADHGCDPTHKAHTDHTREYVPTMIYGKSAKSNIAIGERETLSDIAQTIADIFELEPLETGQSFKNLIL
jgi:phosphopentomutase